MKVLKLMTAVAGIALAGLGGSMAVTNPGQKAYEHYAEEQLTVYLKENICTQVSKGLGDLVQRQCNSLVDIGRPQFKQVISQKTERQNFVFFSIYQTDLSITSSLPSYHFKTVGVFQNFYIYEAEQF
ncbi:MAG: DUF4359 domain-containing protein [Xenococcaceae cyanobacterium]